MMKACNGRERKNTKTISEVLNRNNDLRKINTLKV